MEGRVSKSQKEKMITPAWTSLKYHEPQSRLWRTSSRFVAVAAGRGSGKTELARRRLVRFLAVKKPWDTPLYFYAGPTYGQARRVAWQYLKDLTPKEWLLSPPSESSMVIKTIFGSELHVVGMDKPQRIEGVQWDGGVIDESSDQKPKVFDLTVRPALSHREGWCWRIGVPKRHGVGAREFRSCFDKNSGWEAYNWPSSDIIEASEIELARNMLDAKDFAEQYEASWVRAGGMAFHSFDTEKHVRPVTYDDTRPVVVGSDFNVNPMAWVLAHKTSDGIDIFDEIWLRDTNTKRTLDVLHARYPNHRGGWHFMGDATGRARKTAATFSDYVIINRDERFSGNVRYPRANPNVKDRLASCNALFYHNRCHVDPRCENLIMDLEFRSLDDSGHPDDAGDQGHITDALGYVIHTLYPVRYVMQGDISLSLETAQ